MNPDKNTKGAPAKYILDSVLGRGTMGVVYKGRVGKDGSQVAVKVLRQDLLSQSERPHVIRRFFREARISMDLRHPNIVRVLDVGERGKHVYLVMELIAGRELKDLIDRPDRLPLESVFNIMAQLLGAMDYTHEHGVVHRDIKPANIMVDTDLHIKIMDFGIAQVESAEMTLAGAILGTPAYMSPEQVLSQKVDGRADIFSAGVLLYRFLTGKKPFTGQLTSIMHQILNHHPPAPSSENNRLPGEIDSIVAKAMAKNRDDRYPTAAVFLKALEEVRAGIRETSVFGHDDSCVTGDLDEAAVDEAIAVRQTAGPEAFGRISGRLKDALRDALKAEITPSRLSRLEKDLKAYVDSARQPAGEEFPAQDRNPASAIDRDLEYFTGSILPRLRDMIDGGAPVREKDGWHEGRDDWMKAIDLFKQLSRIIFKLGKPEKVESIARSIRNTLIERIMMYGHYLNQLICNPDHLPLSVIGMDFMRLEGLQWGVEELGGTEDILGVGNDIRIFAGLIMRRINTSIRKFVTTRDIEARFDVAAMLQDADELIVLASRLLETAPDEVSSDRGYHRVVGMEILADFVDNLKELVEISSVELTEDIGNPKLSPSAFAGRLRQLTRLYRFSLLIDDEECIPKLQELTETVYNRLHQLFDKTMLSFKVDHKTDRESEAPPILQTRITAIYNTAEYLGWTHFCDRLKEVLRDQLSPSQE